MDCARQCSQTPFAPETSPESTSRARICGLGLALCPMAHQSDTRMLTLHGLKLKGFAEAEAVAALTGLDHSTATFELTALAAEGLCLRREGRISGWALTPTGRDTYRQLLHHDVEASGAQQQVDQAYRGFLVLNGLLLRVCTDWQVCDLEANVLNDHQDPEYDAAVIERLAEVHHGVTPICEQLSGRLTRYDPYHGRFSAAVDKVRSGLVEWFARPIIDSYHTVWMELHEDLLATLAIERGSEGH